MNDHGAPKKRYCLGKTMARTYVIFQVLCFIQVAGVDVELTK